VLARVLVDAFFCFRCKFAGVLSFMMCDAFCFGYMFAVVLSFMLVDAFFVLHVSIDSTTSRVLPFLRIKSHSL